MTPREFLHAFNKSAYFLHKLKNYKLKMVGTVANPGIRCGLPVSGHKRRLWQVCHDFGAPYLVALGVKGAYVIHVSNESVTNSLIDDIPGDIVGQLIDDLSQTDKLRVAKSVQLLLKPEQVTFRLKQSSVSFNRRGDNYIDNFRYHHIKIFIAK